MTSQEQKAAASGSKQKNTSTVVDPVVVKLGRKKKKDIRKLHKGKGRLFAKVMEVNSDLNSSGVLDGENGLIVVVVKEKDKKSKRKRGFL